MFKNLKYFVIVLLLTIAVVGCQKDEPTENESLIKTETGIERVYVNTDNRTPKIETETGERVGTYYGIFYKESLTIDSVLVDNIFRIQNTYSKMMVDSVFLYRVPGTTRTKIDGVWHYTYNVYLKAKNGNVKYLGKNWSVQAGDTLKYVPYGSNVVYEFNKNLWTRIKKDTSIVTYYDWFYGQPKIRYKYTITSELNQPGIEWLNANYYSGTVFILPHK